MNKLLLAFFLLLISTINLLSQNRIVFSGNSYLVIDNSSKLVVENSNSNGITNIGSGGIKSESEFDQVVWKIGTNTGTYIVPFVGSNSNIQIPFTTIINSPGIGNGEIWYSTFPGNNWDNNTYRPSDVTHMFDFNTNTVNNSSYVIDRFWIVDPLFYTSKPNATFNFTYIDAEHLQIGNTIVEGNLGAQRFNSSSNIWGDYLPQGTTNTTANTVNGVPVNPTNFYRSWTLSLITNPLNSIIEYVNYECLSNNAVIEWKLGSSLIFDHFQIKLLNENGEFIDEKTINFYENEEIYSFSTEDNRISIIEITGVDVNGGKIILEELTINCQNENSDFVFYNDNEITLTANVSRDLEDLLQIYDASGKIVYEESIQLKKGINKIYIPFYKVSSGLYHIKSSEIKNWNSKIVKH